MAGRIRSLKPELLEDAITAGLSHLEFRLFVSMLLMADDYGNLRATPNLILGTAFWAVEESAANVSLSLSRLQLNGLVRTYQIRGQWYAHITGWEKHQRVDKPGKPRVPSEKEALENHSPTIRESVANDSRINGEPPVPDLRSPTSDQEQKGPPEIPAAAPATPGTVIDESPELRAIETELRRWPATARLEVDQIAPMLLERWKTIGLVGGIKLEWVLTSIGQAAFDGASENAATLTKRLRTYVDNTKMPRRAPEQISDAVKPRVPNPLEIAEAEHKAKLAAGWVPPPRVQTAFELELLASAERKAAAAAAFESGVFKAKLALADADPDAVAPTDRRGAKTA